MGHPRRSGLRDHQLRVASQRLHDPDHGRHQHARFDGLTNGTSYTFSVQATNEEGAGAWSGESSAVIPAGPPTAPSLTSVAPQAIGQLTATWSGADANGSPILRHELSINGGNPIAVANGGHTATGLANSTSYDLRVRACNEVGCSGYSGTLSSTTWGPPSQPVGINASAGNGTGQVNWSTPSTTGGTAITSFHFSLSDGTVRALGPDVRTQTFTGLTNNTTYSAFVMACNAVGCGPGVSASFTPTQPPVTLSLSRGGSYTGPGCVSDNCEYLHIETRNLTPSAEVSLRCFDSVDGQFKTVSRTADATGSLSDDPCFMGYPGRQVWVTVSDPNRGITNSNTMTW